MSELSEIEVKRLRRQARQVCEPDIAELCDSHESLRATLKEQQDRLDAQAKVIEALVEALEGITSALVISGSKKEREGRETAIQSAWVSARAALALAAALEEK